MYITITGMKHYYGIEIFRLNQTLLLQKEKDNPVDCEAIKVMIDGGILVGYVSNSLYTKVNGTYSAGYISREFELNAKAKVSFIFHDVVIAELIMDNVND